MDGDQGFHVHLDVCCCNSTVHGGVVFHMFPGWVQDVHVVKAGPAAVVGPPLMMAYAFVSWLLFHSLAMRLPVGPVVILFKMWPNDNSNIFACLDLHP
jgi:hypothetical protein